MNIAVPRRAEAASAAHGERQDSTQSFTNGTSRLTGQHAVFHERHIKTEQVKDQPEHSNHRADKGSCGEDGRTYGKRRHYSQRDSQEPDGKIP